VAENDKLSLIANVAANYLRRNSIGVEQIAAVISSVTQAIEGAAKQLESGIAPDAPSMPSGPVAAAEKPTPAVSIKKSVHRDYIVCLEDGFHAKTLKRHLRVAHGMSPAQYREKWGLRKDYPIVAPTYSESRAAMAKKLGLGVKMQAARAKNARKKSRAPRAAGQGQSA
jgi:predicted transcriptional regulator